MPEWNTTGKWLKEAIAQFNRIEKLIFRNPMKTHAVAMWHESHICTTKIRIKC